MKEMDDEDEVNIINDNDNSNDNEQLLIKPLLPNKDNSIKNYENMKNYGFSRFFINEYDIYCESRFKIKQIITLKYSLLKIFFFILLSIFTLGIINIIIKFFPHLKLYLLFQEVELRKSSYVGIYCEDGFFYIEKIFKNLLPNIEKIPLKKFVSSNIPKSNRIYSFIFKDYKYIYNEDKKCFNYISFNLNGTEDEIIKSFWNGLSSNEIKYQELIYGKNIINIDIYNYFRLFINEIRKTFHIFIIISIIIWFLNDYIIYSIIVLILFIFLIKDNIVENMKYLQNLRNLTKISDNIEIYVYERDINNCVFKILKNVDDLVPGEVYELPKGGDFGNNIIPCDSLIIQGNALVNESIITGETHPVCKSALLRTNNIFNSQTCQNSILYSGTKIIQSYMNHNLNKDNNSPKALVIGTSFMTKKGRNLRSILYKDNNINKNKFNEDKNKYIIALFIYSFFGSLFVFRYSTTEIIIDKYKMIIKLLFIITIIVPPILPLCINLGLGNSIKRLKKHNIKCISKEKINISGTIDTICFEPINILNENNIDLMRIQPVIINFEGKILFDKVYQNIDENIARAYNNFQKKTNNIDIINNNNINNNEDAQYFNEEHNQLFLECMACCNSLNFDNTGKIYADIIDLKTFESTKWKYKKYNGGIIQLYLRPPQEIELEQKIKNSLNDETENEIIKNHYEIGIVKNFDNYSNFGKKCCLVKNLNDKNYKLFIKGSPEIIKDLCDNNSIPENYDLILNNNIKDGNQVISLAYISIKNQSFKNINNNIDLNQFKSNMTFLGFIIIKNKIKENASNTINKLKKKKYKIILSTYKDTLTAINISKNINIITQEDILFTIKLDNDNIKFKHVENYSDVEVFQTIENFYEIESEMKSRLLDKEYLDEKFEFYEEQSSNDNNIINNENIKKKKMTEDDYLNIELKDNSLNSLYPSINKNIMIIDGPTFEKIYLLRNKYISTEDKKYLMYYNAFNLIIYKCRLFSNMNSNNKMILIKSLKELGKIICTCSNNVNDFGSLKLSDIGLCFNCEVNGEGEPNYVNEQNDFGKIIFLLKEGKNALVSSIQIFKIIILYSFIQFSSVIILLFNNSNLTKIQFLVSDLVIIVICYLISKTDTYKKFSYHKLTGSLINPSMLLSLIFQIVLVIFFQVLSIILLKKAKWYINYIGTNDYDNSIIFLISNMQYLTYSITFSITYPFKKNIFKNYLFIIFILLGFSYFSYLIIEPDSISLKYLNLNVFPFYYFRRIFLFICLLNLFCSYIFESYLVPNIVFHFFKK